RTTSVQAKVHSTARRTTRLKASQIEPRHPSKLRAKLPARAIDTGSQAAAATNTTTATARSTELDTQRRTGTPAPETKPSAAMAFPAGNPPGRTVSRYPALDTSEATETTVIASSVRASRAFISRCCSVCSLTSELTRT